MLTFHIALLRDILEATGQPPIQQIARLPAVSEVYRLTIHYFDKRARDSVGTLFCHRGESRVEIVYRETFHGKALTYPIPDSRIAAFAAALRKAGFDKLPDQEDLPDYDAADLWLVERAAGSFKHNAIVAPTLARDSYAGVVTAIRTLLPEFFKQIR